MTGTKSGNKKVTKDSKDSKAVLARNVDCDGFHDLRIIAEDHEPVCVLCVRCESWWPVGEEQDGR